MRRCQECSAPRKDAICHKCGSETFEPCAGWEEPKIPPIDVIRSLAKIKGYAIGVHGTLERDLDLIAAPWVGSAESPNDLLDYLSFNLPARVIEVEEKPLGRIAASLKMDGWYKVIDISICPIEKK